MDKTEVVNKANEFLKKAKQYIMFNRVVLFGSYENGTPGEGSDIDIAFFVNDSSENIESTPECHIFINPTF